MARINKATEIVLQYMGDFYFCGVGYGKDGASFLTAEQVLDQALTEVEDAADEYYDSEWFPLVATPAIRKTIDWDYITEQLNDEVCRINAILMFGGLDDNGEIAPGFEQPVYW